MVDGVSSATEALARLRAAHDDATPYALALVDFMMPGMDGLELGRRLQADPVLRECPLIFLTSAGQRGRAVEAKAIGFSAYLAKPIRQAQLVACIQSVIGQQADAPPRDRIPPVTQRRLQQEASAQPPTRVLLAEDNPVNQKVAVLMLEKLGCRVDVVTTGLQAIAAVTRLSGDVYELVLMDCQMPELDGFAATGEIRQRLSPDSHLPIIAMTANAMMGDRERCLAAGMDDYLAKPVTRKALSDMIDRWVSTERRSDLAAANPVRANVAPRDVEVSTPA